MMMAGSLTAMAAGPAAQPLVRSAPPAMTAVRAAVLYDAATGRILAERHPSARLPVGSLVKLMTARIALLDGRPAEPLVVPAAATEVPETRADLVPGQRIRLGLLTAVLLIRSANDAAVTIATGMAGTQQAFVARMNAAAERLGLRDTRYADASGLDAPGQWSSAADVGRLAALDMRLPRFRQLVVERQVSLPGGHVFRNVNDYLRTDPAAAGIKSGYTTRADFCVAAAERRNGRLLIAVVLGGPNWPTVDTLALHLLDWGYATAPASGSG